MSNTLAANITLKVQPSLSDALGAWSIPLFSFIQQLASGTSAEQFDVLYAATRTIASSGSPDSLDLVGVLKQVNQTNADFAKVCLLIIQNLDTTNSLIVGGGSNCVALFSDVSDKLVIKPSGFIILGATEGTAYTVTASTADILQSACSGGTNVLYNVWILGRSA